MKDKKVKIMEMSVDILLQDCEDVNISNNKNIVKYIFDCLKKKYGETNVYVISSGNCSGTTNKIVDMKSYLEQVQEDRHCE